MIVSLPDREGEISVSVVKMHVCKRNASPIAFRSRGCVFVVVVGGGY